MGLLPWVVAGVAIVARVNFTVVGLLVSTLALYELWDAQRQSTLSNLD